jgi:large subunit ribosomal protein L31
MKQGIHPDYHEITVIMTDGTTFTTRSCYGKPGETIRLDIDPKSHPAWTGQQRAVVDTAGQVAKFSKRFAVDMSKMNIKAAASINKGAGAKAAAAAAAAAAKNAPAKKKK